MVGVEVGLLHDVHHAVDRIGHVIRVGVVPGDHRVEAVVELDARPDGVEADAVVELAQPVQRAASLRGSEVVEDRLRHQEVGGARADLGLELRHAEGGVEREVDVVAKQQVAGLGLLGVGRPVVAAVSRRLEQDAVVVERELAAHSAPTSTSSRRAADSARSTASRLVSPRAIT